MKINYKASRFKLISLTSMTKTSILFISLLTLSLSTQAQFSSSTYDYKESTAYSTHDSVFIFNQSPLAKKGSLTATTPAKISARFEWSRYDTINKVFQAPFNTEDNVISSTVTALETGGYRVHVTGTGIDTTMTGWVYLNDFTVTIEKNNDGEVLFYRKTCESTNLIASSAYKNFKYHNLLTGKPDSLLNEVKYTWSSSPMAASEFNYEGAKIWIEGEDLPSEDTEYTVTATDKAGLSKEDKVTYITIIPKAAFDTTFERKYGEKISAPLTVTLTNNSKNAVKYTWIFGDGDTTYLKEPERDPDPHIYYVSKKTYLIKLIAESNERCVREDTVSITVDGSELEAPNFFTPDGDDYNSFFRIYNISLCNFHITIFSQYGRKVYEFSGPDINHWDGWDGKIGNTDASAGIYYYVIEARSCESPSVKYRPTKKSGFVYLIRGN
jgi:gliding motility-associated-like protein